MPDLLTSNHKLDMATAHGWLAKGVSLLPGRKSGREFCPHRGACFRTCLDTAGHGASPVVEAARLWRSKLWIEAPEAYLGLLDREVGRHAEAAERRSLRACVRLNVFSDIAWEEEAPDLFHSYPSVQFYDYTKSPERARASLRPGWPPNYDLTYSWSENTTPWFASRFLRDGGRVAYVHREGSDMPPVIQRADHVDGDEHDLNFIHRPGVVQLLKPKGKLHTQHTRFA